MAKVLYNGKEYESGSTTLQQAEYLFEQHFGLIETLLFDNGRMPFWIEHGKRIRCSISMMGWDLPDRFLAVISDGVLHLVTVNKLFKKARIRLRLFYADSQLHYILEALPFSESTDILRIGIAKDLEVIPGERSFLKSNKRKVYQDAAGQGAEQDLQDMLLLNPAGRIVESTIANIFWEKNGKLFTPPLSEGCIAGIFREALLSQSVNYHGMPVSEQVLSVEDALGADALYLTNALRGIRKVDEFQVK